MSSWFRKRNPGIDSNTRRKEDIIRRGMEKTEVIREIENLIERIDLILKPESKTDLLKYIQEQFPQENFVSLDEVDIEYFRKLLLEIIRFSKKEIEKAEIS